MLVRRRAPLRVLLLSLIAVSLAAGPALAHRVSTVAAQQSPVTQATPEDLGSEPLTGTPGDGSLAATVVPGLITLAALATLASARRRRREIVASLLVALVAVFAFEDALHSVHHGLDPAEAKGCAIAVAAAHVTGSTVDLVAATDLVAPPSEGQRIELGLAKPTARVPRSGRDRAPPA